MKRPFIGVFMIFLVLGCFSVIQEKSVGVIEKHTQGQLEGVVFDIVEKANTTQLHLKNGIFYDEAEKKSYPVGNILIYYSKGLNPNANQGSNQNSSYDSEQSNVAILNKNIKIGNQIQVKGSLENFRTPRNQGQFNEWFYYRSREYRYKFYGEEIKILDTSVWKISEILRGIRKKFSEVYEKYFITKEAGVVKAMVLGEKSGLSEDIKNLYQQNGISHVMAISGLHISMLGMGFYKILEKVGSPKKVSSVLGIVFIWLYGLMTGFSISTNRAVVMLMLSLIAGIVGRTYDMATALSISGIIILAQKPMLCMDCGFLLSFGSIVGIGYFYPLLEKVLDFEVLSKKFVKVNSKLEKLMKDSIISVMKSLLASLSVQMVTFPIILYFYYEIPIYGVILNIIVIPLMSLLLGMAILGGIAGVLVPVFPALSKFFLGSVHAILVIYEKSGEWFRELPFSQIVVGKPEIWQIIIYYGTLALIGKVLYLLVYEEKKLRKFMNKQLSVNGRENLLKAMENWRKLPLYGKVGILGIIFLSLTLILIPVEKWGLGGLEITFIDVGQGDSIFIKNGNGIACLIDGGSTDESNVGTYRIMPFLKSKGVGELDYVMVTHADSDHMNGIVELLEKSRKGGIVINHLVLPMTNLMEENYEKLVTLAEENEIPIIYIKEGNRLVNGQLKLTCLHPAEEFVPENTNSYSMVLEVEYDNFKALLTGDLERSGEERLIENRLLEDVLLLKVGHHGSKNSSSEKFLETVKPELAIISCGKDNSYGHPHEETLERMKAVGSKVMNTADYGGITVKVKGRKVWVEGYVNY